MSICLPLFCPSPWRNPFILHHKFSNIWKIDHIFHNPLPSKLRSSFCMHLNSSLPRSFSSLSKSLKYSAENCEDSFWLLLSPIPKGYFRKLQVNILCLFTQRLILNLRSTEISIPFFTSQISPILLYNFVFVLNAGFYFCCL